MHFREKLLISFSMHRTKTKALYSLLIRGRRPIIMQRKTFNRNKSPSKKDTLNHYKTVQKCLLAVFCYYFQVWGLPEMQNSFFLFYYILWKFKYHCLVQTFHGWLKVCFKALFLIFMTHTNHAKKRTGKSWYYTENLPLWQFFLLYN